MFDLDQAGERHAAENIVKAAGTKPLCARLTLGKFIFEQGQVADAWPGTIGRLSAQCRDNVSNLPKPSMIKNAGWPRLVWPPRGRAWQNNTSRTVKLQKPYWYSRHQRRLMSGESPAGKRATAAT